jgi:aminoglycoside phosphotransferase (APT) family kinase protein
MFVLELLASDLYAVLGRFLDTARVAGLKLAAVSARESAGRYAIRATIDVRDAESVERLARKLRTMVGVADVVIGQGSPRQDQSHETETLLVS